MSRRQVTRTRTVTTEHRVEFTAEELRKRLRLPEDAVLEWAPIHPDDQKPARIIATWTTTATKEDE